MRVRSLPVDERPRERLLSSGPEALSGTELLAILLRTGGGKRSVMELASHILEQYGGIAELCRVTPNELLSIPGVGKAKAAAILAAIELAKRIFGGQENKSQSSWEGRLQEWISRLGLEEREFVVAIYADDEEAFVGEDRLSYGGLDGAFIDVKYLLRRALRMGASKVILLHNHPDGALEASDEDIGLTKMLSQMMRLVGLEFLGHCIVAHGSYKWVK
ncbi:MAG: DNA repair protein RadC [Synergistales bacterium 54_24]|nr:MAG: DNA repair protein RadC [Synergistales bacterium 54_24]